MRREIITALLTATLAGAAGCTGHLRVYDAPHGDYHQWNDGEERAYRAYLTERHLDNREFKRLDNGQQADYWKWRHEHPDRDRR